MTMRRAILFALAPAAALFLAAGAGAASQSCPDIVQQVCAAKGGEHKTYANPCVARRDGATNIVAGECVDPPLPRTTFCAEVFLPVCALKDGVRKTYSNACFAKGDGAAIVQDGKC
jgi:Kazal-type serine protease inhibitor-like protein